MARRGRFGGRKPWRRLGAGLIAASLAACAPLPRGGPTGWQILYAPDEPALAVQVVPLTAEVAAAIATPERPRLAPALIEAAEENAALIGPGDILALTIWESVEDGLFASGGRRATTIDALPVDETGSIFVPYVGLVGAAGRTVGSLREIVRRRLEPHTLSPEVDIRRIEQRSRAVSVQGVVARQGIYPLEAQASRLLNMIAAAGGAIGDPGQLEVVLRREGVSASTSLDDVFASPELDVALRPGDTILVRPIREQFTVLGAVRRPGRFGFTTRAMSLLDALGETGGLADEQADPRGVFVFRRPAEADATTSVPGAPEEPALGRIYHLDMSRPEAMFVAGRFALRDDDLIYVSNAPFTELRKVLSVILPTVGFVGSVNSLVAP